AELQPAWSPDGRSIAFVTDRFSSNLDSLSFGGYRLALLDVASGSVREVETFRDAKSINPQWSPDGRWLYFVSDRGGISNIYRTSPGGGGTPSQLTNLTTGVSGITDLSPCLSVARAAQKLVFSVFEK